MSSLSGTPHFEVVGCVIAGEIYCSDCSPCGDEDEGDPIFAGSEDCYEDYCAECRQPLFPEYVEEKRRREAAEAEVEEIERLAEAQHKKKLEGLNERIAEVEEELAGLRACTSKLEAILKQLIEERDKEEESCD